MNKALLLAAGLVLVSVPVWSQGSPRSDDRDPSYDRRDRDWWRDERRRDRDEDGPRRGARFKLRSGNTSVAVRCDPGESMRACIDSTLTLLDKVRSLPPATGTPPGQTPPSP